MQITQSERGETGERIHFSGQIALPALESEYRRQQIRSDLGVAGVILLVNAIGTLLFATSDYRLFGSGHPFPFLVGLRIALVLFSFVVWRILQSATKTKNPRRFDLAMLVVCGVMALSQVYVGTTRPATYTGHFLVHLVTVLLLYVAVPLPFRFQALPALMMTVGMGFCMWIDPPQDGLTIQAITWTLVGVNVLGACVSRQLQYSKRQLFIAHSHEVETRRRLEAALGELKTLRGIIPICAHCRSVRDDAGSWEELEQYVLRHSDAEFSHGVCPTCLNKHFGSYVE